MVQYQRVSNNQIVTLDPVPLYTGGEGIIYGCCESTGLVAKIYRKPTGERANKLLAMAANPPNDPMASRGHTSIAWPVDLLTIPGNRSEIAGFLMPRINEARQIFEFYNPGKRRTICPGFNFKYLLRTARNLTSAMNALHDCGYIVGDVNELNILVTNTALVTLIDTDSFQVRDPKTGAAWRCLVGKPDFTPPELQGKDFSQIDRSREHDLFALGAINFLLLMEGNHPFNARYLGKDEPAPREERIASGIFPYISGGNPSYVPPPHAPPFFTLDPVIQDLFRRCFEEGHHNPRARPTTREWGRGLEQAEQNLISCSVNPQNHWYGKHLIRCPWCERAGKYNQDPFSPLASARPADNYQKPLPPLNTQSQPQPASSVKRASSPRTGPRTSPAPVSRWNSRYTVFQAAVSGILIGFIIFLVYSFLSSRDQGISPESPVIRPDLTITGLGWIPASPSTGQSVTITAAVSNPGTGPSSPCKVVFSMDGNQIGESAGLSAVGEGTAEIFTCTWTAADAGEHVLKAAVDSENEIAEIDETNNEAIAFLRVIPVNNPD